MTMTMTRTTATFSVSLPPEMASELERVRKAEHRTRSELVREALRHYIREADTRSLASRIASLPEEEATPEERDAITEGQTDFREGRQVTLDQLRHALRRPSH
ncbi:CopG family transcriptional regulator / antitoxin EndoAI [Azospirillaceae bacterium]